MRIRTIMTIGIAVGLAVRTPSVYADTNTESDIKVMLSPEVFQNVTNSPEMTAQVHFRHRLLSKIPQATEGYSLSTLGQLAKLCEAVIVGRVQEVKDITECDKNSTFSRDYLLTLFSVSNLLEGRIASPVSVKFHQGPWKVDLKTGDDVIVFLSSDKLRFEWGIFDFDFEKKSAKKNESLFVLGESRGILVFKKFDPNDEIFNTVKQYLELLRRPRRNPNAYYEFLAKTIRSSNERLRRDSVSDLLFFLRTSKSFDLTRVLSDDSVDDNIKDYMRRVLIPDREKQSLK